VIGKCLFRLMIAPVLLLFLVLNWCHAHADSTHWYLVPDSTDSSKQVIVGAGGFAPPNAIAEAPAVDGGAPPVEAIDIVDVPDPVGGGTHKEARINQTKLDAKKAADAKAKSDQAMADAIRQGGRLSRLNRLKAACPNLTGVQKDLCDWILDKEN
jgi:hypothetical protein